MELHTICFRGNYRRNEIFFCLLFPLVNPSVIIFFYYQRIYRWTKNYQRKIHRQRLFIGDFVGNFFTNGMVVQLPTENSVGKSKDCGSVIHLDCKKDWNSWDIYSPPESDRRILTATENWVSTRAKNSLNIWKNSDLFCKKYTYVYLL
jgi:hypothetical protein